MICSHCEVRREMFLSDSQRNFDINTSGKTSYSPHRYNRGQQLPVEVEGFPDVSIGTSHPRRFNSNFRIASDTPNAFSVRADIRLRNSRTVGMIRLLWL